MKQRIDRIVLRYIKRRQYPRSLSYLASTIGVRRLYSSLVRLRRKGLIDSVPGEAIAGGARRQLYFAKEV